MRALLIAITCVVMTGAAFAELQNVEVGGEIRIEGNYVTNWAAKPGPIAPRVLPNLLGGRSIGEIFSGAPANNGLGIFSPYSWDSSHAEGLSFVEQRTKLHVTADFTDDVRAFIEFDSYDVWGDDFRSNYITGADMSATTGITPSVTGPEGDIEVYQAYIEANEMFGMPVRLRIGRQELSFGSEWLVGPKEFGPYFVGTSFDAIRLTYAGEGYSVDAFWSKLAERFAIEEDGDVDFYGVYASCSAVEGHVFDLYWLYLRDARSLNDTNFIFALEWLEDLIGADDYDVSELHTVGLRATGKISAFDYALETAYQFGDAGQQGFAFKPFLYGDDSEEFSEWGLKLDLGYTFDVKWQPRVFVGYSYYGGEDNRDISFSEWLNPFDRPDASVSFNRLFSDHLYNGWFDLQHNMSNVHTPRVGTIFHPRPTVHVFAELSYYKVDDPFDMPVHVNIGRFRLPLAPGLPFVTSESDDELGFATNLVITYNYSDALTFTLQWAHLFAGDGLHDGSFVDWNGLMFNGGTDDDDSDFITVETRLSF